MTRIIQTSTPGKERAQLSKAIVITIREFMRCKEPSQNTNDMIAFVILAIEEIADGIEKSVVAWENRGYWVKADKYRMDWRWAEPLAAKLRTALTGEQWAVIAELAIEVMGHFSNIKVSDRHRMGQPWIGAYKHLNK